jgi:lipopolysaccharide transport system permease protein
MNDKNIPVNEEIRMSSLEEQLGEVGVSNRDLIGPSTSPFIRIRPTKGWVSLNFEELWRYRELLYFFVWRDIKIRYKQTILGASWAIIQPLFTMVIFSLFFGRLAGVPSDGIPYPLFSYTALVPWTFFANGVTQASNSLVNNADMIRKIYFPRIDLPIATVFAGLLDFTLAFIVLIGMVIGYSVVPAANYDAQLTFRVMWLPLFLLLALVTTLGVSFWFSALNAQFRDVRFVVPFLIQAWLFITPIAYPSSLLSEPWRTLYGINPMAGVVEGFRWAFLGTDTAPGSMMILSILASVLIFVGGIYYFRRMETKMADVL